MKTKLLGLDIDPSEIFHIPTATKHDNQGYSAPFPVWWEHFPLRSQTGYAIGEPIDRSQVLNQRMQLLYEVQGVVGVDIKNSDLICDITKSFLPHVDFILCMAVLEHTFDPVGAMRQMKNSLKDGGHLYISVPINGFKQHRRPVDCFRFLEDAFTGFAEICNLTLIDYVDCKKEWCVFYRKPIKEIITHTY